MNAVAGLLFCIVAQASFMPQIYGFPVSVPIDGLHLKQYILRYLVPKGLYAAQNKGFCVKVWK